MTAEAREDGILIRPAVIVPVERYGPEYKAEFLLSTATTVADYRRARKAVKKLGVDPDSIPHRRPNRRTDCTARETEWRIPIAPRQRLAQFEFLLNFLNLNLCSLHLTLGLRTCRSKAFFAPSVALHFRGI